MIKYILPLIITLFFLMGTASADLGYTCEDGNSFHNWTIDSDVYNITEPCIFGCDTNSGVCLDNPEDSGFAISLILGFFAIAFIFGYVSMNIDPKKHGPLQVLMMMVSIYSLLGILSVMIGSSEILVITKFNPILVGFITILNISIYFTIMYMIVSFVKNLLEALVEIQRRKKDPDFAKFGVMK